jgi:hypothetical protein
MGTARALGFHGLAWVREEDANAAAERLKEVLQTGLSLSSTWGMRGT